MLRSQRGWEFFAALVYLLFTISAVYENQIESNEKRKKQATKKQEKECKKSSLKQKYKRTTSVNARHGYDSEK